MISVEEVQEIEQSTPFLKPGKILDDKELVNGTMTLEDFEFVD